jgi:hypothetical protein
MSFSVYAGRDKQMKKALPVLSLVCLTACLAAPVLHFLGKLSAAGNKRLFLAASIGWFVLAALWFRRR